MQVPISTNHPNNRTIPFDVRILASIAVGLEEQLQVSTPIFPIVKLVLGNVSAPSLATSS
jgi:hypothetical protein